MNPDLHFDAREILATLRPWVECESPTHDAAAVNRMMGVAARFFVAGPGRRNCWPTTGSLPLI